MWFLNWGLGEFLIVPKRKGARFGQTPCRMSRVFDPPKSSDCRCDEVPGNLVSSLPPRQYACCETNFSPHLLPPLSPAWGGICSVVVGTMLTVWVFSYMMNPFQAGWGSGAMMWRQSQCHYSDAVGFLNIIWMGSRKEVLAFALVKDPMVFFQSRGSAPVRFHWRMY